MSQQGDVFEPETILAILKSAEPTLSAKNKFESEWRANVSKRASKWKSHKDNAGVLEEQLIFESSVVEYTDYLRKQLVVHKKASAYKRDAKLSIKKNIPFLGPRFLPPTYTHVLRRAATPTIRPETAYMKPITVVHWVFFPTAISDQCPQCQSSDTTWDGWNVTGGRDVYGICINERAIGYQLRCKRCKEQNVSDASNKVAFCFVTTNRIFWDGWERWRIPKGIPYFFKRAAVTHELYRLVVELRPSSTSAGLAEHIKQLHLLEYQQRVVEYMLHFEAAPTNPLEEMSRKLVNTYIPMSSPTDPRGYNDSPITNDFITEVYLDFVNGTGGRQLESTHYGRTRGAISVSLDNTFKSAGKATVVTQDRRRENPMNGGILSALNELNEGLAWRYCMTASPIEIQELLSGLCKRLASMGLARALAVIVDNCCAVRRFIEAAFGKGILVCLDVFHFIRRYGAVIYRGTKNPFQREVLATIKDAIIKTSSKHGRPATYWSREEQGIRLVDAYNKWVVKGGIWSAAAPKVHADQLEHVHKGCLARPDNVDIALDGSRIEGSHKGWNSIQRAHPSGLEVYTALAHDHFHRRNIRIGTVRVGEKRPGINLPEFVESLNGSHYVYLANHIAQLSNSLARKKPGEAQIIRPTLPDAHGSETFGLVESHHTTTFGGLIAEESSTLTSELMYDPLLDEHNSESDEQSTNHIIQTLGLDENLIRTPLDKPSTSNTKGTKRKELNQPDTSNNTGSRALTPDPKRRRHNVRPATPGKSPVGDEDALIIDSDSDSPIQATTATITCEPSDNVIQSVSDVVLPSGTSGSSNTLRASWAFMPAAIEAGTSHLATGSASQRLQVIGGSLKASKTGLLSSKQLTATEVLHGRLPLPANLKAKGLTRSQLLFSVGTTVDFRSLLIGAKDEFFLFMDMRKEYQWTSFMMTMERWATATAVYNARLEKLAKDKYFTFIKKYPQALQRKLSIVEDMVISRIAKGDYKSRSSGSEDFWRTHCEAVPALRVKLEAPKDMGAKDGADTGAEADGEPEAGGTKAGKMPRKIATCTRCCTRMYGRAGAPNHNKGYCADGAPQKAKKGSIDLSLPEYPQPRGIFVKGKRFDAATFLTAVYNLYERIIEYESVKNELTTAFESDTILEDRAFSEMLKARTKVVDGHSFFLLFEGLELTLSDQSLVSTFDGRLYLRMDCL